MVDETNPNPAAAPGSSGSVSLARGSPPTFRVNTGRAYTPKLNAGKLLERKGVTWRELLVNGKWRRYASPRKASRMCVALPRRVGVNPFQVVSVNGRDVTVPVGARLSGAIQAAGMKNPDTILPQLRVTKLFRCKPTSVEFDRQSDGILNLQLTGGERISWLDGKY
jgi:hypothetical protein